MSKLTSKDHQERVIRTLLDAGWEPDGETRQETVRIPTQRSPLYGKSGGELATFGGRPRFRKGARRVTVGPRTTCFYEITRLDGGLHKPVGFVNKPTRELSENGLGEHE